MFRLLLCTRITFTHLENRYNMWNELTFWWNDLTILWNDLTIVWNDLTWNNLTMERNDRIPYLSNRSNDQTFIACNLFNICALFNITERMNPISILRRQGTNCKKSTCRLYCRILHNSIFLFRIVRGN